MILCHHLSGIIRKRPSPVQNAEAQTNRSAAVMLIHMWHAMIVIAVRSL